MQRLALGIVALAVACGGRQPGVLDHVPTDCPDGILTIHVENRTTHTVNLYWLRYRAQAARARDGERIASQVARPGTTKFACRKRWLNQKVFIAVDPIGAEPYLISHLGETVTADAEALTILVKHPPQHSTYMVH